jgi:SAM-dependent methyltransferase
VKHPAVSFAIFGVFGKSPKQSRTVKRQGFMAKTKSEAYWKQLSERINSPVETKNKRPDTSDLEIAFLRDHVDAHADVLDLGSGTGLIINKLIDFVGHITAVEKFEGFTRFIREHKHMLVINADLIGFKMRKHFDVALLFGVAQCFIKDEMRDIYGNLFEMVRPGGKLIVRMQCGLEQDILVDGFSKELDTHYFAEYRQKDHEIAFLQEIGFTDVQVYDIFPDTLNVWENSRHFIFICHKPR